MGTAIILDEVSLLTIDDLRELRQVAAQLPFDVRILIRSGTSAPELARATEAQVTSERVMAIGIDPAARTTSVYFGRALRIPPTQHAAIRSAANAHFRTGHFTDGITAIQEAAAQVVQVQSPLAATPSPDAPVPTPVPAPVTATPPPKTQATVGLPPQLREEAVSSSDYWWTFFLCAMGFGIFVFAVGTWVLYRQRKFALAARAWTPEPVPTSPAPRTDDMPPPSLRATSYYEDDDDANIPTQMYTHRPSRSATTVIDRDRHPPETMPRPRTPNRPRDDDEPQDYMDHRYRHDLDRRDDDSGAPILAIAGLSALAGYAAGRSSASSPSAPAAPALRTPLPPPVAQEDEGRKGWTSAHGDSGVWSEPSASSGGDTGGWGDSGGGSDGGTSEW